ncbi:MAG: CYTH domain-containing protein [Gammaproteobacteria bacterium]|nr:MAG: CYTH domain-containing protein [Gammaproteobacteria bacterium]
MAIEIERKFLLRDDSWREQADAGVFYRQGYLAGDLLSSVRVRLAGDKAWLNIKEATSTIRRLEYEYPIPAEDAAELLQELCADNRIDKTRYHVHHAGHLWEVDVFEGANAGLVVAEIELNDEQEVFETPPWLGEEVSHDPRYYNMNLAKTPYTQW